MSQRMPRSPSRLSPLFRRAQHLHERGALDQAERLYAAILRRDPGHFDALHLLAMLNYQRGQRDAALELLRAALRIEARRADAQSDLGLVLIGLARFQEALSRYHPPLAPPPHHPHPPT